MSDLLGCADRQVLVSKVLKRTFNDLVLCPAPDFIPVLWARSVQAIA
jgi:hypothetical protein